MIWLYICIGGVIGSLGRYWFAAFLAKQFPTLESYIPTLFINGIGSFLLGLILNVTVGMNDSFSSLILGATVGVIGSFTTYSTFSLDCVKLLLDKKWFRFFQYSISTFSLSIFSFLIGYYFSKII
ncbi:fluoride efflux transporter FluC [Bacillus sp. DJP31]|uniref:fluoride efflux transporter FluC n=1 Tax=Bacillus sp. DJP31 TaxID=3409789 RepID=UPI003BB7DA78